MIELHILGRSDDSTRLLLAAHPDADTPGYFLTASEDIVDLLREEPESPAAPEEPEPEPEPEVVLPEGPIDVESPSAALEAAHGLWLVKDESEISDKALHEAVHHNLEKWNVRIDRAILDEGWWATKLGDRAWQIGFRFLSRGRIHEVEWVLDTERARLEPETELAGVLGWVKDPPARQRARRRRRGRGRSRSGSRRR